MLHVYASQEHEVQEGEAYIVIPDPPGGSVPPQAAPIHPSAPAEPTPKPKEIRMASIIVNIEKGIEVGAEDLLKFITGAQSELKAAPQVVAALGTLLGAFSTAVASTSSAAEASGLNVVLDEQAAANIKAVWPALVAFAATLGIKL
jgi:hypothetical protein